MDFKLCSLKAGSRDFSAYDIDKVAECMDQEKVINTHVGHYLNHCAFKLEGQQGFFPVN